MKKRGLKELPVRSVPKLSSLGNSVEKKGIIRDERLAQMETEILYLNFLRKKYVTAKKSAGKIRSLKINPFATDPDIRESRAIGKMLASSLTYGDGVARFS